VRTLPLLLAALAASLSAVPVRAGPQYTPVTIRTFWRSLSGTASELNSPEFRDAVRLLASPEHLRLVLASAEVALEASSGSPAPSPQLSESKILRGAHAWIKENLRNNRDSELHLKIKSFSMAQPPAVAVVAGELRPDYTEVKFVLSLHKPNWQKDTKRHLWLLFQGKRGKIADADIIPADLPQDLDPSWR
jgi:hypothetical protein